MTSKIKWETSNPTDGFCSCIVTTKSGIVRTAIWLKERGWMSTSLFHELHNVIAWCKLDNIEPYKNN